MKNSSKFNSNQLLPLTRRMPMAACAALLALSSMMAGSATPCDWTAFIHLDRADMRTHLIHFQPLEPPCCSKGLNLAGLVELRVAFNTHGDVVCAKALKGHPVAIQSAMQAVKQWKFRPYESGGKARPAFGDIVVRYRLADRGSTSHVE